MVLRFWVAVTGLAVAVAGLRAQAADDSFRPSIPKTWDDEAVASLEVPLAVADASPVQGQGTGLQRRAKTYFVSSASSL